jgi:L-ascorbate metabolism protein UlaG (beta-lactamase superfamily)
MRVTKFGHSCLLVEDNNARILIDPGAFSKGFDNLEGLGAILITHQHADHMTADIVGALLKRNPDAKIYADEDSARILSQQAGLKVTAVHDGDKFEIGDMSVRVIGVDHAVIYSKIPGIPNVGYMVNEKLFHPGDNFTVPEEPVPVLALPIGAPWLKVGEVIDYVLAVRPKVAIPIHDAVLAMPEMNIGIINGFAEPEDIIIQVVPNGSSAEV